MKMFMSLMAAGIALGLMLVACSTATAGSKETVSQGSKEEAVNKAWKKFCKAGYCEGYSGRIVDRTTDTLTVRINRNTRYIWYVVSGEPGNYTAYMNSKCDHGRINKTTC